VSEHKYDEQLIISYLLGALPEKEAERLDEQSLTDDEFVERLRAVENDLVDAYVQGELSQQNLESFKGHYLASPRRREKVQLAQAFQVLADKRVTAQEKAAPKAMMARAEAQKSSPQGSVWRRFFPATLVPRLSLQWALAAVVLLMLLVGGYFMLEYSRLRKQMAQTQAERALLQEREQELQKQLADEQAADSETAKELARVRERLAQLEQQLGGERPGEEKPVPEGRDLKVVAVTLAPQLRSGNQIPSVAVPKSTDYVDLQLELESTDFPAYQVALKNPATGQVIWRSGKIKITRANRALPLRLRAGLLKAQNYTLDLSGISNTGASEIIGSYTFKVIAQ
jgi:hypothetical protein